jgi:hypothetical protein
MAKTKPPSEFITGTVQQLLFSPKGGIEGALVKVRGAVLQISFDPTTGNTFAKTAGAGKRLRVHAVPDHSPKTADGEHPVYQFESFADAAGNALEWVEADNDHTTVKGVVASIHYARHGQPNGVVLESGEFIHLRPHGMAQVGLGIGARVTAIGAARMTVLGTQMLEAHTVNRVAIE